MWSSPLGIVATLAGWFVAEFGRQPWTVYGLMRTTEAASALDPHHVMISMISIAITYAIILVFYLRYLGRLIKAGPDSSLADHVPPMYMAGRIASEDNT